MTMSKVSMIKGTIYMTKEMIPITKEMIPMVNEMISMVMEMVSVSRRLGHKCPIKHTCDSPQSGLPEGKVNSGMV